MAENTKNPEEVVDVTEVQEQPSGQEQTQEQPQSARERLLARQRERYPDRNFDDEEELYGSVNDDYDNYENDINGYKEREQGLVEMMDADPRSATFLDVWRKGGNPLVELIRIFGPELKEALDDPEKLDEFEEAHKAYMEKVEQAKVDEKTYQDNLRKSLENIDEMAGQLGMSEEDVQTAMTNLLAIIKDANQGIYTPATLELLLKALNHDNDVQTAAQEAEVRGRNAKIKEQLRKPEANNTPQLNGARARAPQGNAEANSIFDLARQAR